LERNISRLRTNSTAPITNTSAENLAAHVGGEIRSRMREQWPALRVRRLQVGIEETPGQQGVYTRED